MNNSLAILVYVRVNGPLPRRVPPKYLTTTTNVLSRLFLWIISIRPQSMVNYVIGMAISIAVTAIATFVLSKTMKEK